MLEKFKRIKLGHFPTPIEHLKNISKHLDGPNIFIKRDICTCISISTQQHTQNQDRYRFLHTS